MGRAYTCRRPKAQSAGESVRAILPSIGTVLRIDARTIAALGLAGLLMAASIALPHADACFAEDHRAADDKPPHTS